MGINNPALVRMTKIDNLLRTKKYVSNREMREILEVKDKKTIYSIINYMQESMGAPIEYDKKLKHWYYSEENYKMEALNLSEGELFSIFIAAKALEQYSNTPFYDKLLKVFNRIKELLPDKIKFDPDEISQGIHFRLDSLTEYSIDIFNTITKSVKDSWEMEIEYSAITSDETTTRIIQPYFIFNKRGDWYIYAKCLLRNDFRLFALHRIKKARLTEEVFLKDDIDPNKIIGGHFDHPGGKGSYNIEIIIKYPTSLYASERKWHSTQKIKQNNDNSITLSYTANSLRETTRWILSMGSDAIVKKPALLKNIIKEEIALMAENY